MRNEFYESAKWKRKRAYILKRDGYRCQLCKKFGKFTQATQVHHIKHLEDAPELAYSNENLVALCLGCHNKQHPEKGGCWR